ncbi:hypothetical protein JYU34_020013 [Plutella xylostella]|uniref:Uncharacterized protein n=1 Tax=Plutella xylostella TaxID=51655 RepID=A0ABQ7PVU9_PLUXY|nr:hypothetical protein JYU34_020013 [Plutella xylostella]
MDGHARHRFQKDPIIWQHPGGRRRRTRTQARRGCARWLMKRSLEEERENK